MKYYPPYGLTDPDAPYTNGNPATGTMGSIPPAYSIEHPQREIVNFLNDSQFTPDQNDLRQLSKSVQGGRVNYCDDQGSANFIAITPLPQLAGYVLGQHFRVKVAFANTGPVQVNVSGLGWVPVVHGDKTPMGGGELFAGQIIDLAFDGETWQMMTGGLSGSLIMMTNPRALYCDNVLGDDSLYDGTQATVDATHGHGPYKTLRKALTTLTKYNLSGFTFHIYLADGTYPETALLDAPTPNGSGNVFIHGNPGQPNLVKLINSGNGSCFRVFGGFYLLDGISFAATQATPNDGAPGLWISGAGGVWLYSVGFYYAPGGHIMCGPGGGHISVQGPLYLYGGSDGAHQTAIQNGAITFWGNPLPTLNVMNNAPFAEFAYATSGGQMSAAYAAINLNGHSITGYKFIASANGVIDVGGRGDGYLPGSIAGVRATGGQCV